MILIIFLDTFSPKRFFMKALTVFFFAFAAVQSLFGTSLENSIVKIHQTYNSYSYYSPWSAPSQGRASGSGFVIEGNRILTNAHVVANSVFLQVQFGHKPERHRAYIEWIDHHCDLAIIRLVHDELLQNTLPLEFGECLAYAQDEVIALGYPIGGEELSITRGILSRTEMHYYSHGGRFLLSSQIDAAINPGNSGGPVLSEGKVVGVVHMGCFGGQNLGYMIPLPIIQHFLTEIKTGSYEGFPMGGVTIRTMESPALREYYHMKTNQTGILVTEVKENSFFLDKLFPGDVILFIEGVPIENNGNISLDDKHWIYFAHLFSQKFYGETIALKILRQREEIPLYILIDKEQKAERLVRDKEYEKRPTYYVKGGLVFQPLNSNYVQFLDSRDSCPSYLENYAYYGRVKEGRKEIVILSRVLPDDVNLGYQSVANEVVYEVNGKKVNHMLDLIEAIESHEGEFHRILTEQHSEIILDREAIDQRDCEILSQYLISADRSEDLR